MSFTTSIQMTFWAQDSLESCMEVRTVEIFANTVKKRFFGSLLFLYILCLYQARLAGSIMFSSCPFVCLSVTKVVKMMF